MNKQIEIIKLKFENSKMVLEFNNKQEVMNYLKNNPMFELISVELIGTNWMETFSLYSMRSKEFFGKTYKIVKGK